MRFLRRAVSAAVVTAYGVCTLPANAQDQPAAVPEPVHAGPDTPAPADSTGAAAPATLEPPPKDPTNPEGPKSEKAVLQAKEAELTPIVPSPRDVTRPAYQLFAETDLPLLGIGLVFGSSRLLRTQPAYCAPSCDPSTLNALDRTTAGFYNPTWASASDIGILSLGLGAGAVLWLDEGFLPAVNDMVVVAESGLTATAFSSIMTLAAGRPRPFLYGDKASLATRNSADAGLSYLSSHASISFALATSLYMTERRLRPTGSVPYVVFAVGLAAASFVATARVMAGRHFITDSIGGAVVGTSVGVLVPALHGSPVRVVPTVAPKQGGLSLTGAF
jgi:membrane-associated phospholipid phosphatase